MSRRIDAGPFGGTNFYVSIKRQDNHSFQGSIKWLDLGLTVHFRSQLEMMNLIQEASINGQKDSMRTWDDAKSIREV